MAVHCGAVEAEVWDSVNHGMLQRIRFGTELRVPDTFVSLDSFSLLS